MSGTGDISKWFCGELSWIVVNDTLSCGIGVFDALYYINCLVARRELFCDRDRSCVEKAQCKS